MDPKKANSLLAKRIIALRKGQNMTSQQLAIKIGMSSSGLRYIEREKKDPRFSSLFAIAKGLQMPVHKLVELE